jgi:hypothetical protein
MVLATGGLTAAVFVRRPLAFLLAVYVLVLAELVLLTEALSVGDFVSRSGYLSGAVVLLLAALFLWHRQGRPTPTFARLDYGTIAAHPILVALTCAFVLSVGYEIFIAVATPPNNGDALKYHLPRAAHWLQQGGLDLAPVPWVTRGIEFQPNGEIPVLFSFAFLRTDAGATLAQLASHLALVAAVIELSRRIGYSRPAALFAGLVTGSLTLIALQAVTPKNDLMVAALVVTSAAFLCSQGPQYLALAGLAAGLAAGTKLTALLALPILLLLAILHQSRRHLFLAGAFALAGFIGFGAYSYVERAFEVNGPMSPTTGSDYWRPEVTLPGTASTVGRVLWHFIDLSGFRVRTEWLEPISSIGRFVFEVLDIPKQPPESRGFLFDFQINVISDVDRSFFGPLGILLIVPLSLVFAAAWPMRKATAAQWACGLALLVVTLEIGLTFRFSNEGRFLIVPAACAMALAASLYPRRLIAGAIAAISVLTVAFAHLYNVAKPTGVGGSEPIWRLSRPEAQGYGLPGASALFSTIEERVPTDARVGVVAGDSDFVFPLFGPSLERRLIALPRGRAIASAQKGGLSWVFLGREIKVPVLHPGWSIVARTDAGMLVQRHNTPKRR